MKLVSRPHLVLAAFLALACTASFAEDGAALYKANCQSCHGPAGTPSAGMAKMMGVKASTEYKTSEKEQFDSVKNGKNKMKPFAGKLSDDQIKAAVAYFRTLK